MRFSQEEYAAYLAKKNKAGQKVPAAKVSAAGGSTPLIEQNGSPPPVSGKQRLHALGRKKKGEMNATEARYANYLRGLMIAGEILWWKFEGVKLILADRTTLTVDFNVMEASGALVMIDVKGAKAIIEEDAKVKMKVAAEQYPFIFRYAFPRTKKEGGGWSHEEI